MNSKLSDTQEHIGDLKVRIMKITEPEHQTEKQVKKKENTLRGLLR